MKKQLLRILATTATVGAVLGASAGAHAANVTLTGWAYGSANAVQATGYSGLAGGFTGSLTGAGMHDTSSFLTYCVELEEYFAFGNAAITGYQVVDGASYFERRRADADIADRLGRLMTYVAGLASPAADSTASSGLQLAIWNMIYDDDYSLTTAGRFNDSSSLRAVADGFLAGAQTVGTSRVGRVSLGSGTRLG